MYKLSIYNYYIPNNDRIIYFNGISSIIFSVSKEEHQNLQQIFKDLISFDVYYHSIFQKFIEWRFIIDERLDEKDILRYRNRKAVFLDKGYKLVINPTLECNFNCWYCYEKHPKGFMSKEIVEKCKKHIQYMLEHENISYLLLDWFGGEPLLYFDEVIYPIGLYAREICEQYQKPFYHYATTNAYKIDSDMANKMSKIGFNGFQIAIDGDEDRHNKIRNENGKGSFAKIINNINLLCSELPNIKITLRINYDNVTLQESNFEEIFSKIIPDYRKK